MPVTLVSPYFIDRVSHFREDSAWIQTQLSNATTRLIVTYQSSVLCLNSDATNPCFLSPDSVSADLEISVFIGQVDGITYFALPIRTEEVSQGFSQTYQATFQKNHRDAPVMQSEYRDLVSLACFSDYWHSRHQHCGACGSATRIDSGGHRCICTSESCARQYFPSMDPAVIVLIESEDRCLLGRQKNWRAGMHSTLAGFVEPGENAEDAVAREVYEEAGIQVEGIRYHSSQSWLFPNSLMLGFTAKATTSELNIDTNELETADWFTREQINANPQMLPSQRSISYALIQDWLDG